MEFLPTLEQFIKLGPVCFALLAAAIFVALKYRKKESIEFVDIFIVGMAGTSIPSGLLLIYAAFDQSVLTKVSDSNVYIAFAGIPRGEFNS